MNHPKSKFGRRYDEAFKRQTVALIRSQRRSRRQLSRELGVSEWSLSRWYQQYARRRRRPPGRGGPVASGVGSRQPPARHLGSYPVKKNLGHLGAGALERYEMIAKMKAEPADGSCPFSTAELCAALEVSPSGLYAHQQKARGVRHQQDAQLAQQIGVLFLQSRATYGCRRLCHALQRQQVRCGTNRVCRLMRQQGLQARQKRRFRPRTTQSRQDEPVAPNRLAQLPGPPPRPNQVWAADLSLPAPPRRGLVLPGGRIGPLLPARGRLALGRVAGRAAGH